MHEELIKRLRDESQNIGWSTKMLALANLLDEAADALSAPAVQVPRREHLEAIAAEVVDCRMRDVQRHSDRHAGLHGGGLSEHARPTPVDGEG